MPALRQPATRGILLAVLALAFLLSVPALAPCQRIVSLPQRQETTPGTEAEVLVSIDDADGVIGYRFSYQFDPVFVSYVSGSVTTEGTLAEGFLPPAVNERTPGVLTISAAGSQAIPAGPGVLLRLRFLLSDQALPDSLHEIRFDRSLSRLNDGFIPCTFVDGSLLVRSSCVISLPKSLPIAPGETVAARVMLSRSDDVRSFTIAYGYDSETVEVVEGSLSLSGSILGTQLSSLTDSSYPGLVRISWNGEPPEPDGGVLFSVAFRGIGIPPTNDMLTPLTLVRTDTQLNGGALPVQLLDGSLLLKAPASRPIVYIPRKIAAAPGERVLVPVWITNAGGVAGIRVAVDYDPEVLHFVQGRLFRECALTEHWAAALAHEDSPGRVVISAAGLQPLGDGPGVLFAFELEATSELTDEEPLQFDPAFSRLNDGLLAADFLDGSLHAAPAANLSLPVDEVLLPAQTVAVPVTIIGPAPLNGFRVAIRFDERLWELMPEPVSLADTIASAFEILVVNAEQPGLVLVSAAGSAPASAVDGVLVHINLRPRDGLANGTLLPLEWDPYLTRLQDGAIAARLHDGRFIFRTTTTPTPTATQTPSPTPTPCCSTRSGVIDRLLVRNDKDPSAFDANGDGVLDAADTAWCRE